MKQEHDEQSYGQRHSRQHLSGDARRSALRSTTSSTSQTPRCPLYGSEYPDSSRRPGRLSEDLKHKLLETVLEREFEHHLNHQRVLDGNDSREQIDVFRTPTAQSHPSRFLFDIGPDFHRSRDGYDYSTLAFIGDVDVKDDDDDDDHFYDTIIHRADVHCSDASVQHVDTSAMRCAGGGDVVASVADQQQHHRQRQEETQHHRREEAATAEVELLRLPPPPPPQSHLPLVSTCSTPASEPCASDSETPAEVVVAVAAAAAVRRTARRNAGVPPSRYADEASPREVATRVVEDRETSPPAASTSSSTAC